LRRRARRKGGKRRWAAHWREKKFKKIIKKPRQIIFNC
jgi:hypothetical protein